MAGSTGSTHGLSAVMMPETRPTRMRVGMSGIRSGGRVGWALVDERSSGLALAYGQTSSSFTDASTTRVSVGVSSPAAGDWVQTCQFESST